MGRGNRIWSAFHTFSLFIQSSSYYSTSLDWVIMINARARQCYVSNRFIIIIFGISLYHVTIPAPLVLFLFYGPDELQKNSSIFVSSFT